MTMDPVRFMTTSSRVGKSGRVRTNRDSVRICVFCPRSKHTLALLGILLAPCYNGPVAKSYTVSDGKLVLTLTAADEGGFVVTSPVEPELVTEANTIEDAFRMAHD